MLTFRFACRPLALALVVLASSLSPAAQPSKSVPSCIERSWAGAVVIIPAAPQIWTQVPLEPGHTIAAVTFDGRCVGSVAWDGGGVALTVWMDDPVTEQRDGLAADEVFMLAVWDDDQIETLRARLGPYWLQSTIAYASYVSKQSPWNGVTPDALFMVQARRSHRLARPKALATSPPVPSEVTLDAPFPNPARSLVRLPVGLPSPVEVAIEVVDVRGRRVAAPATGHLEAGLHTVPLDVSDLASGLYVVRLTAGDVVRQRQMVVVD